MDALVRADKYRLRGMNIISESKNQKRLVLKVKLLDR